jgi:hypothetical protein
LVPTAHGARSQECSVVEARSYGGAIKRISFASHSQNHPVPICGLTKPLPEQNFGLWSGLRNLSVAQPIAFDF